MGQAIQRGQDRRKHWRYKKAINGWCEVGGIRFESRTYEISEVGMTLFTYATLPAVKLYKVRCRLESGIETDFSVEEKTRRTLHRGNLEFLRIGVKIVEESLDTVVFFRELTEQQAREGLFKEPEEEAVSNQRLDFQLPVITTIEGEIWRCQTLDMGSWGLSVLAPSNFPKVEDLHLTCIDPEGNDIIIRAQERNRASVPNGIRVGFLVTEGARSFRDFVEKYAHWQ